MAEVGIDTILAGDLPAGAANFTSLAAHAAKTQEDWDDELKNAEIARWGNSGVLGGLFQGLAQGKPFIVALIQAIVQKAFGVSDTHTTIADALENLRSRFDTKWTALDGAQTTAANAMAAATLLDSDLTNTNATIENLASSGNRVISPNFEIPLINRFAFGGATNAYTTADKYLGTRSYRITTNAALAQGVYLSPTGSTRSFEVQPGETFNIKTKIKPVSGNGTGSGGLYLTVYWWAAGSPLSDTSVGITNAAMLSGWQDLNAIVTAPATADKMDVVVAASSSTPIGNGYYLDAAQVREETTAQAIVDGINQGVNGGSGVGNLLATVKANLQTAWDKAVNGFAAAGIAQGSADLADGKAVTANTAITQIGESLIGANPTPINTAVQNVQEFLAGLAGWKNSTNAQVISYSANVERNRKGVCRYPIGFVSYAEELNIRFSLFGDTGAASTGTAHTHTLAGNGGNAQSAGFGVAQHQARGAYIYCSYPTPIKRIGFTAWVTSGTPTDVFLEVFRVKDSGSVVRIHSQDISAIVDTNGILREVDLSTPILVQGDEQYVVRIRNSGAVTVFQQSITRTPMMEQTGFFTNGQSLTEQTSYTSGEAVTARGAQSYTPFFFMVDPDASIQDMTYFDNFDRASLGGGYERKSSTANDLGILLGQISYTGVTDGNQNVFVTTPTNSDRMLVEADLSWIELAIVSGARAGLLICVARDWSQVVYLEVGPTSSRILSGAWDSLTQRATVSVGGSGKWSIEYDPGTKVYTARKNGSTVGLSWTDSGDLTAHGRDTRYGGMRISRASGVTGGLIDSLTVRDNPAT